MTIQKALGEVMQYLAALWDDKEKCGAFPQLYSNDSKEAEEFIRNCDREGRTVVRCVGELQDNAKERRIETVKSLSFLHGGIDLRELADVAKDDVIQKLKALPLPLRLHDSGRGVIRTSRSRLRPERRNMTAPAHCARN